MIDRVDVRRYRLPMRTPFRVHGATIGEREGWLIRVSAGEHHGLGEAAPLPWFGTETMQDAGEMLERARGLVGRSVDDALVWVDETIGARTARAALHTALADVEARRAGLPLARSLGAATTGPLRVHAAVGRGQDAVEAVQRAQDHGIGHVKLKLGRSMVEELTARIADAATVAPGIRFRLDANGAWTRDEAQRWLQALEGLPIDFVEQPVTAGDVDGLVALAAESPVPVAIDEGLLSAEGRAAAERGAVPVVMIKPMVLGGPVEAVRLGRACSAAGARCVVTTFIDAAVGRAMATHVAAALAPEGVHGLATGPLLGSDIGRGPRLADGHVWVPAGAGLGDDLAVGW